MRQSWQNLNAKINTIFFLIFIILGEFASVVVNIIVPYRIFNKAFQNNTAL